MFEFIRESNANAADAVRRDVLGAIEGYPPAHLWRIASRVKWQPSRVRIALEGMQRDGVAKCDYDGKWGLR